MTAVNHTDAMKRIMSKRDAKAAQPVDVVDEWRVDLCERPDVWWTVARFDSLPEAAQSYERHVDEMSREAAWRGVRIVRNGVLIVKWEVMR